MSPAGMQSFDSRTLLKKAVNDCLLYQQAETLEMDQEPAIVAELEETRRAAAMGAYRDARFHPRNAVSEDQIRAEFEKYYWKIQVRQLTVREEAEALALREQILAGADMEALARELSLDVMKNKGGLHNLKWWRDVELEIRPAAIDLQVGELSDPFPYRGVWSLIRCEDRTELVEEAFGNMEPSIRDFLVGEQTKAEWRAFVDSLMGVYEVEEDAAILEDIAADGDFVLEGRFLEGGDGVALRCGDRLTVSDRELRKTISRVAMQDGTAPFEQVFDRGLRQKRGELALTRAALEAGYYDSAPVNALVENQRRDLLVEQYLSETIASQIVFNRDELNEFYEEHIDQWRGPEEVLLDVLVLANLDEAQEMERRLADGADFDFLRQQMELGEPSQSEWAPLQAFSPTIQAEVERLEIGEGSAIVPIPTGSMLFQLEGRRPGKPRPFEEVEIQVRGVVFQRKFNALLDEHLALLEERSDIEYHEDAIEAYYGVIGD
jgi:parvulin-like peptidyl-prolyl isomerase